MYAGAAFEIKSFIFTTSPPPPRTKWTRRVPHPVLIGHAVCLVQVVREDFSASAVLPLAIPAVAPTMPGAEEGS
jgi:hypothetical protein